MIPKTRSKVCDEGLKKGIVFNQEWLFFEKVRPKRLSAHGHPHGKASKSEPGVLVVRHAPEYPRMSPTPRSSPRHGNPFFLKQGVDNWPIQNVDYRLLYLKLMFALIFIVLPHGVNMIMIGLAYNFLKFSKLPIHYLTRNTLFFTPMVVIQQI